MKSPFLIIPDFISPLACERMLAEVEVKQADVDVNGDAIKTERVCLQLEQEIIERFRDIIPQIESRYDSTYRGLEQPLFQFYPENSKAPAEPPGCENSKYLRKKWVKTKDTDLVGFIWLKDFNSEVPLDPRHEVFGGKMEFPSFNFSLVPQRGTLVMFPASPHFITVISPILLGSLYQIKLNVSMRTKEGTMWFYQPANFPGRWTDWLSSHM